MGYFWRLFLWSFLFLTLFSCKRDYEYDENASIIGSWKPIKATAYKTVAGFTVSQSEDMNACQQQSKMTYRADGTATEVRFDNVSGNCEKTLERNFTYTFNSIQRSLVHTFQDGSIKNAEVVSITSQKLIVKGKKEINGEMYDVEVINTKINQ